MKKILDRKNTLTYILILSILIPLIFIIKKTTTLDNDIWYLLTEGKYIVRYGIYHIDPFSIHDNFEVVVQNWGAVSLFWIIYSNFNAIGIMTIILLANLLICYLLYKICMLISDNRKLISIILTFLTDIILIYPYMVSRPQIFSFALLLFAIYKLELYAKDENVKHLYWIPLISFLEINMHASLWCMLYAFIFCYLLDSFNIKFLHTQGYKTKPILKATIASLLAAIINPYGIKAITFIFGSYTEMTQLDYVMELAPFSFNDILCAIIFFMIIIVGLLYTIYRKGNVRLRYICLFCGTMLIAFNSIKGSNLFILVSLFHLAYFFKDIKKRKFKLITKIQPVLNVILIISIVISSVILIKDYIKMDNDKLNYNVAEKALDTLNNVTYDEEIKFYSNYNDGGYVEFRGYRSYIDPRGEVFLKSNNKKADILNETIEMYTEKFDVDEFLKKYNFTHLLVGPGDRLYSDINNYNSNYFILYEDPINGYRLYARNDLYSEKERKQYTKNYTFKHGGEA